MKIQGSVLMSYSQSAIVQQRSVRIHHWASVGELPVSPRRRRRSSEQSERDHARRLAGHIWLRGDILLHRKQLTVSRPARVRPPSSAERAQQNRRSPRQAWQVRPSHLPSPISYLPLTALPFVVSSRHELTYRRPDQYHSANNLAGLSIAQHNVVHSPSVVSANRAKFDPSKGLPAIKPTKPEGGWRSEEERQRVRREVWSSALGWQEEGEEVVLGGKDSRVVCLSFELVRPRVAGQR